MILFICRKPSYYSYYYTMCPVIKRKLSASNWPNLSLNVNMIIMGYYAFTHVIPAGVVFVCRYRGIIYATVALKIPQLNFP